ncbi:MAG: DUF2442 domain-containing protein [Chloroflexi bacterium]|nr:DUF2442 domain-containing protein [Chloroflexota bacterium]
MITLVNNIETQVSATAVSFTDDILHVNLNDGRIISVPLDQIEWLNWLTQASSEQRQKWEIEPGGYAVYWDNLDDGIEVAHLLAMQPLA